MLSDARATVNDGSNVSQTYTTKSQQRFDDFLARQNKISRCPECGRPLVHSETGRACIICHNSPQQITVANYPNGVQVTVSTPEHLRQPKPADETKRKSKRGKITEYSRRSYNRLTRFVAKAKLKHSGHFITLTYPSVYPDPNASKKHLDIFIKRLRRRFPDCYYVWKLEPQKRGAPHFHLLVFNMQSSARNIRPWLASAWYEVVSSGDEKHLAAGTQCDVIKSENAAIGYAAKYTTKPEEAPDWEYTGRWWGYGGDWDTAPLEVHQIDIHELIEMRRQMVKWLKSKGVRYHKRLSQLSAGVGWFVITGLDTTKGDSVQMQILRAIKREYQEALMAYEGSQ